MDVPEYEAQRLRQELANDARIGELGIEVRIVGDRAMLNGKVATAERKETIGVVAHEVLPELTIVNELTVTELESPEPETLP